MRGEQPVNGSGGFGCQRPFRVLLVEINPLMAGLGELRLRLAFSVHKVQTFPRKEIVWQNI